MRDIRTFNLRNDLQNAVVGDVYTVIGVLSIKNECCPEKPVLLTGNGYPDSKERPDGINYSCQCACGVRCTTGYATPGEAVNAYSQFKRK